VKAPKKARRVEDRTVFLFLRRGKVALTRRPDTGLLAGLWEFPNVDGALDESAAPAAVTAWGIEPKAWKNKLTAKHIFTHVEWHMTGYTLEVTGGGPPDWVWVDADGLEAHAVPSAFARYYAEAREKIKEKR
jgi:A/G-specific adenine glycosylase